MGLEFGVHLFMCLVRESMHYWVRMSCIIYQGAGIVFAFQRAINYERDTRTRATPIGGSKDLRQESGSSGHGTDNRRPKIRNGLNVDSGSTEVSKAYKTYSQNLATQVWNQSAISAYSLQIAISTWSPYFSGNSGDKHWALWPSTSVKQSSLHSHRSHASIVFMINYFDTDRKPHTFSIFSDNCSYKSTMNYKLRNSKIKGLTFSPPMFSCLSQVPQLACSQELWALSPTLQGKCWSVLPMAPTSSHSHVNITTATQQQHH